MPVIVPNFIALRQSVYDKSVTIFFTSLVYILAPHGDPMGQRSPILALMYSKAHVSLHTMPRQ